MAAPTIQNVGDPWGRGESWFMHYCGACGRTLHAGVDKVCQKCGEPVEYTNHDAQDAGEGR